MSAKLTPSLITGLTLTAVACNQQKPVDQNLTLFSFGPATHESYVRSNSVASAPYLQNSGPSFHLRFTTLAEHVDESTLGKSAPYIKNENFYDKNLDELATACPTSVLSNLSHAVRDPFLSPGHKVVAIDLLLHRNTLGENTKLLSELFKTTDISEWVVKRSLGVFVRKHYKDPDFAPAFAEFAKTVAPTEEAVTILSDALTLFDTGRDTQRAILHVLLERTDVGSSIKIDALVQLARLTTDGFGDRAALLPYLSTLTQVVEQEPALKGETASVSTQFSIDRNDKDRGHNNQSKLFETAGHLGDSATYRKAVDLASTSLNEGELNAARLCIEGFVSHNYIDPKLFASDIEKILYHLASTSQSGTDRLINYLSLCRDGVSDELYSKILFGVAERCLAEGNLTAPFIRATSASLLAAHHSDFLKFVELYKDATLEFETKSALIALLWYAPDPIHLPYLLSLRSESAEWPKEFYQRYIAALARCARSADNESKDKVRSWVLDQSKSAAPEIALPALRSLGELMTPEIERELSAKLSQPRYAGTAFHALVVGRSPQVRSNVFAHSLTLVLKKNAILDQQLLSEATIDYLAADGTTESTSRLFDLFDAILTTPEYARASARARLLNKSAEALLSGPRSGKMKILNLLQEEQLWPNDEKEIIPIVRKHIGAPEVAVAILRKMQVNTKEFAQLIGGSPVSSVSREWINGLKEASKAPDAFGLSPSLALQAHNFIRLVEDLHFINPFFVSADCAKQILDGRARSSRPNLSGEYVNIVIGSHDTSGVYQRLANLVNSTIAQNLTPVVYQISCFKGPSPTSLESIIREVRTVSEAQGGRRAVAFVPFVHSRQYTMGLSAEEYDDVLPGIGNNILHIAFEQKLKEMNPEVLVKDGGVVPTLACEVGRSELTPFARPWLPTFDTHDNVLRLWRRVLPHAEWVAGATESTAYGGLSSTNEYAFLYSVPSLRLYRDGIVVTNAPTKMNSFEANY